MVGNGRFLGLYLGSVLVSAQLFTRIMGVNLIASSSLARKDSLTHLMTPWAREALLGLTKLDGYCCQDACSACIMCGRSPKKGHNLARKNTAAT